MNFEEKKNEKEESFKIDLKKTKRKERKKEIIQSFAQLNISKSSPVCFPFDM